MSRKSVGIWSTALAMALLLSVSYMLDGPDDIATETAVAADLADAVRTAQVQP
jgi:hypothetical protein